MPYKTILTHLAQNTLTVTLNRPEVRNAFNDVLIGELIHAFEYGAKDPQVRVIILKGAGQAFSAGGDLNWMQASRTYTRERNFTDAAQLGNLLEAINTAERPVVGLVHGGALGGGMGLVAVCDYVIATQDAFFGFSEAKLGLIPAVIGPYVIDKIGVSAARCLILTARLITAARAYEIQLVHQVVNSQKALEEASAHVASQILSLSPNALKEAKHFIHQLRGKTRGEQNHLAAQALADIRITGQAQEGIAAFLEKRKPKW